MKNNKPSDTYKRLYHDIIEEIICVICNSNINYTVPYEIDGDVLPIALWKKFEEYKEKALENMAGARLDRHKLASCICGAVLELKPLIGYNGAQILRDANEKLALFVGLGVIKSYMMYDLAKDKDQLSEFKYFKNDLKKLFEIKFPDPVCDTQEYRKNLTNALYRTRKKCDIVGRSCLHYDIWIYAKIFYHLELHNKNIIEDAYEAARNEYLKKKAIDSKE